MVSLSHKTPLPSTARGMTSENCYDDWAKETQQRGMSRAWRETTTAYAMMSSSRFQTMLFPRFPTNLSTAATTARRHSTISLRRAFRARDADACHRLAQLSGPSHSRLTIDPRVATTEAALPQPTPRDCAESGAGSLPCREPKANLWACTRTLYMYIYIYIYIYIYYTWKPLIM